MSNQIEASLFETEARARVSLRNFAEPSVFIGNSMETVGVI